jgi:hypothetical protein
LSPGNVILIEPSSYIVPISNDKCEFMFSANENDQETWILGQPFLKRMYSIFDTEKGRVAILDLGEKMKLIAKPVTETQLMVDNIAEACMIASCIMSVFVICLVFCNIF